MSPDWSEQTAQQLISQGLCKAGICLLLGASDTGKTTLAMALGRRLAVSNPVGIVDADIGQSHIGPPTTVGWAVVDKPQVDFSQLTAGGISFVGDITPVGHLLQLTAAITQCVRQASKVAELIIIDTPGLIYGPVAAALWWTVQQILKPELILAVQRSDELSDILAGLCFLRSQVEMIRPPPQIPGKSPPERRRYRQNQFKKYFQDSRVYNINLSSISVQSSRRRGVSPVHRLVGLRDSKGVDLAIGLIVDWQKNKDTVVIKAPPLAPPEEEQICCLVIGNATIDIADG